MTQLTLNYSSRQTRKRHAPDCARRMLAYLIATKQWSTRDELVNRCGLSERECRLGCEAAHGRIIFGQRGYKAICYATVDEIAQCGNTILSQIKALQAKYSRLMVRAHRMGKEN